MTEARPFFARRLSRPQLVGLDVLGALVLTMALLPAAKPAVLALLLGLPLAVRRVWPRSVFWLVLAAAAAAIWVGAVGYAYVAPAYALYTVASAGGERRWVSTVTVASAGVGILVLLAVAGPVPEGGRTQVAVDVMFGLAALAGAWSVGRAVHERRAYAARDAAHAAEQAVSDERIRIARELHDVVTHSMGLIAVKAGVANHVLDRQPELAREALATIETVSRGSLGEMRTLLGVLRAEPSRRPMPGISDLAELASRSGAVLEVAVGDGVPEGVGLACYRIVQEALTNVAKHAPGAACRVVVAETGEGLAIEVTDDGSVRHAWSFIEGHGLIGMRERVGMYGGAFEAGVRPEGGFRVSATLPFGDMS